MEKRREAIGQFCQRTDFMAKLRATLEDIENGQAFNVFEGLQVRGNCAVSISFDGNVARIAAVDVRPEVRARTEAVAQEKIETQPLKIERKKQR